MLRLLLPVPALLALGGPAHARPAAPDSREAKLLLDVGRFADRAGGYAAFWALVEEVAAAGGVGVQRDHAPFDERHRQVIFLDTAAQDLHAHGYALRLRTDYAGDRLEREVEIALKFRSEGLDEAMAAPTAVRGMASKTELEEDVARAPEAAQGVRRLYARCTEVESTARRGGELADYARIFPVLSTFGLPDHTPVVPVHDRLIEQWSVSPGRLDFGDGLIAEADLTVWYDQHAAPLMAEFSFDHPIAAFAAQPEAPTARLFAFFAALAASASDWITAGSTKTAFTYDQPPAEAP